jgi:hypothetical protein
VVLHGRHRDVRLNGVRGNSVSPVTPYQASWLPVKGWAFFGGENSIAILGDRFVVGETGKIKSFDEMRHLLREGEP